MKPRQAGFTMIELIVVIVILGVLAATALPKFIDIRSDATAAAIDGVAGAAASAMNLNYSGCVLTNHSTAGANAAKCRTVDSCVDIGDLLQGGLPNGYTAGNAGTDLNATNGTIATCTVSGNGLTRNFVGTSAGNP